MKRVVHSYTQINVAPPGIVFPLLCPVREAEWVPGWKYRMIFSNSGVAELGCVFATPNESGGETIWIVTRYDPPEFAIEFAWTWPEMIATRLEIQLADGEDGTTLTEIRYTYTALTQAGEAELSKYDDSWFERRMKVWEDSINGYLLESRRLPTDFSQGQ